MLLDLFNIVPPTPEQIRLTALAASAAGDAGDAYFYMGEYQLAGGDLNLAAQQLQLALASPHISPDPAPALPGAPGRGARLPDEHAQAPDRRQRRRPGQQGQGQQGHGRPRGTEAARRARLLQCRPLSPADIPCARPPSGPQCCRLALCGSAAAPRCPGLTAQPARPLGAHEPHHLQVQRRARQGDRQARRQGLREGHPAAGAHRRHATSSTTSRPRSSWSTTCCSGR